MALQLPAMPNIPQQSYSWLNGIADSIGGAIQNVKADRSFSGLADRIQGTTPAQQPAGGFLSGLMGKVAGNAPMPLPGAAGEIAVSSPNGSVNYRDAIASIESKGSGDYAAVGPTHPKLGRALGRYQIMESNIGPWSQEALGRAVTPEEFMANPQLQDAVFDHRFGQYVQKYGPEGAAQAWIGGPGGVGKTDRRDSLGTSIGDYGKRFMAAGGGSQVASLDPSAGMLAADAIETVAPQSGGYRDPMVSAPNAYRGSDYNSPMVTYDDRGMRVERPSQQTLQPAQQPIPTQVAQNGAPANAPQAPSTDMIARGITPVQRGSVEPSLIQYMLRDRNLRDMGLKLWAANVEGQKASEPWQFVNLPDGTLARANQQTGAVERLGNFAKPNEDAIVVGDNLVRRSTGEVVYQGQPKTPASYQEFKLAQQDGFKGSYADWEKVKTPGTSVTVNNQDQGEFSKKAAARNVERFGNLADAGTNAASIAQSMPVLRELLTQAPQGPVSGRLAEAFPGFSTAGDAFISQINQIAPTLRVPGSGAMSDKDLDVLMSALPRLRSDPAANQLILNVFERKAQLNADRGAIASQALRGEISPEEADRRIAEIDKTPLLDERSRSMLQNSQGGGTARPQTKADFDALKSGDLYIDPDDGQTYRKP